tara:strand:+ start:467 stop:751 length:285 start_codon:yes stop_codon:yes gene_type:complete
MTNEYIVRPLPRIQSCGISTCRRPLGAQVTSTHGDDEDNAGDVMGKYCRQCAHEIVGRLRRDADAQAAAHEADERQPMSYEQAVQAQGEARRGS